MDSQDIFEGFENFPWGMTVDAFLRENPDALEKTGDSDEEGNQRLFVQREPDREKVFRFFEGKLYWCRIVRTKQNFACVSFLAEKLFERYGSAQVFQDESDNGRVRITYAWTFSPTFSVWFSAFGFHQSLSIFITYKNDEIADKAETYAATKGILGDSSVTE